MPPPLFVNKYAGDNQTAAPGTAVATPPAVYVTDHSGTPYAGAAVTFTVSGGGGSVTGATAFTNAQGIATVGSWVLGAVTGTNTLTATVSGGVSVTFTALAARSSPDITIFIVAPENEGMVVGDTVRTRVQVTSRLQLSSVQVSVAGRTVPLPAVSTGIFDGAVSLVGLPRDTMTMIVTATDINGTSTQALRGIVHDRPPRVTVTQPIDNSVARSSVHISAGCDDDDPGS